MSSIPVLATRRRQVFCKVGATLLLLCACRGNGHEEAGGARSPGGDAGPPAAYSEDVADSGTPPSGSPGGPAGARPDSGRSDGVPADTAAKNTGGETPASPAERAQEEWTAGIRDGKPPAEGGAVLARVETGRHPGFDRVVFEFRDRIPGYHIEYVDRPVHQCGSGNPVALEGDGWLAVTLQPAAAHTEAGEPTVRDRERKPELPVLRELQLTCDFEGQVQWVLGVASPNRYRLLRLDGPPRLVVDVRH